MTLKNIIRLAAVAAVLAVPSSASAHNIFWYMGCPGNSYGTAFCNSTVTDNEAIWMTAGVLNAYNEGGGRYRVIGHYGPSATQVRQNNWNLGHDCWVVWKSVPYGFTVQCSWATGP